MEKANEAEVNVMKLIIKTNEASQKIIKLLRNILQNQHKEFSGLSRRIERFDGFININDENGM